MSIRDRLFALDVADAYGPPRPRASDFHHASLFSRLWDGACPWLRPAQWRRLEDRAERTIPEALRQLGYDSP